MKSCRNRLMVFFMFCPWLRTLSSVASVLSTSFFSAALSLPFNSPGLVCVSKSRFVSLSLSLPKTLNFEVEKSF